MTDIVDPETRSQWMSGIRSRDTKPELAVRCFLHRAGLRFRLGGAGLPGRPDVVLPRWRTVVFVHGCFWHRHQGCRFAYNPKSRPEFWQQKFAENVERDVRNMAALEDLGWRPLVVWECEITPPRLARLISLITAGGDSTR
jgi:DNA mismatch endonuclease, patch repair protein